VDNRQIARNTVTDSPKHRFSQETETMIRKFAMIALALGLFILAGCSTVEGAGQDIQNASKATREAMTD
jgi:predicted small secreted protein